MQNIKVTSLGPIKEADIAFGDLTLMVGPQASGKSILLQLIKLLIDKKNIRNTVEKYGFGWGKNKEEILNRYFGEGMSSIWTDNTSVSFDNKNYPISFLYPKKSDTADTSQQLFYIPAQRILCLQNGWPRYFTDYDGSVPFILKDFSEILRLFTEEYILNDNEISLLNKQGGMKPQMIQSFDHSIFHSAKIGIDNSGKKRFNLNVGRSSIPFPTWSAGQKEFMPLLLSFYYLCSTNKMRKQGEPKYVILEEPEMGLHPQAIQSVLLQVIDLLSRGYKIILSTHSPMLLEFAWAFTNLQKTKSQFKSLLQLFKIEKLTPGIIMMIRNISKSNIKTFFFDRKRDGVIVRDISSLDAGSEDEAIAEWGGLTSFSSKAVDIVSNTL